MNEPKTKNPPAFSRSVFGDWDDEPQSGMTLLDYFAAKIAQGLSVKSRDYGDDPKDIACESYKIAEDMLKEREKHI